MALSNMNKLLFKKYLQSGKEAIKESSTAALVKQGAGKLKQNSGGLLNTGMALYFGSQEYNQAREEGHGVLMSGARAFGDFAVSEALGFWGYMGISALPILPKAAVGGMESLSAMSRSMNRALVQTPFNTASFVDTQQSYTMRQAGMQLAQASKYNLQQTLMGNEAQYMHL